MNLNKFPNNKKYFTICVYCLFVILVGTIIIKAIIAWASTKATIGYIFTILSPFTFGVLIAYLLYPLVKRFTHFFKDICHIKFKSLAKGLSIFLAYGIVFGLILSFLFLIIPELITSISSLINQIPSLYDTLLNEINYLGKKYPDIDFSYFSGLLKTIIPEISSTLKNLALNILPQIYNTSLDIIKGIVNVFIAIIFSVYILIDKERLFVGFNRFFHIFLNDAKLAAMKVHLKKCHQIFGGYIVGKTIDSLIIGVLCFIGMSLLRLDYALLISVVVGITNIIPYFGPYMGAVPSALILLFISPVQCLIFVIWILALQQLDGLVIGPKILGNSTGLRPLWIIFAISIGGSIAGILGMFFGVPTLGIIFYFLDVFLTKKEKEKHLNIESHSENNEILKESETISK